MFTSEQSPRIMRPPRDFLLESDLRKRKKRGKRGGNSISLPPRSVRNFSPLSSRGIIPSLDSTLPICVSSRHELNPLSPPDLFYQIFARFERELGPSIIILQIFFSLPSEKRLGKSENGKKERKRKVEEKFRR